MGLLMLEKFGDGCQLPGASPAEIADCEAKLKIILPAEIKAFLAASNGFNGEVGQGYLVLWSAAELAGADGYEIFEFRDDQLLIGSNGGPTAYGFVKGDYISIPSSLRETG
ncbi:SMI1/KNR4 family protein [Rhizobium laguerreae]|uniref:SMI1/KNR4 family protein n=1 Tax=Rhizobium laguerreae TaxID=1076926 RepID=UPI001FE890E9|nr:SMI1/KNR4 family protein [Rhizobium laguerreae]